MPRPVALFALCAVSLVSTGCGTFTRGHARSQVVAPSGLPWGEEMVRRALVVEGFDQALARTAPGQDGAPDDAVLQAFFRGQTAFYAGQWEESASQFAAADRLAERRQTRSASRGVLSLLTNDHALAYVPPRTERLFSRYYAMLAYVQAGKHEAAGVEARRLSQELERADADGVEASERATHAVLREVAGAVFASNGHWNDAAVAYRNAARLRGVSADSIEAYVEAQTARPSADSATILLVLESGFAAHYVAREVSLPLDNAGWHPAMAPGNGRRSGNRRPRIHSAPEQPLRPPVVGIGDTIVAFGDAHAPGAAPEDATAVAVRAATARSISGLIKRRIEQDTDGGRSGATIPSAPIWSTPLGSLSNTGPTNRRSEASPKAADSTRAHNAAEAVTAGVWADAAATADTGDVNHPAPASDLRGRAEPLTSAPDGDLATRLLAALDAQPDGGVFADEHAGALMANLPADGVHSVALDWTPVGGAGALDRRLGGPWQMGRSWLTVEWPSLVRPRLPATPVRFGVADGPLVLANSPAHAAAFVSDAMAADARRARGARLARLLARSASRAVVVDAVRDKHGDVAGFLASLAGAALERADTRGWHLLPGQVTVVRLTVPAGVGAPALHIGPDPNARAVVLPTEGLAPGATRVVTTRIWRDPPGVTTVAESASDGSPGSIPVRF